MDGSVRASSLTPRAGRHARLGPEPARGKKDPLALILGEDERWSLTTVFFTLAIVLHLGVVAFGIASNWLRDLRLAVEQNQAALHEYLWRTYDVEVIKPKHAPPPPPPPPEPAPPEPAPVAKAPVLKPMDDPYK